MVDGFRAGHADGDRLEGEQAAGRQRVAFQGHGQGEDEFADQDPAGDEGADGIEENGIDDEEDDDRELIPCRGVAEKIAGEGLG